MNRAFTLLLCGLLFSVVGMSRKDMLNNTVWNVEILPDEDSRGNGAKDFKDALTFKQFKFSSKELAGKGFEPVTYGEDTRGVGLQGFNADVTSKSEGSARWIGTVTGDQMSGDLTWTRKDGTKWNYTFRGQKKT